MPNWCETTYKIVGDKKELDELFLILEKMESRKEPAVENGFGIMWLGELVTELGFDWKKLRCRGRINYFEYEDDVLSIYQETAWCEQEGVREAITKRFPSLSVYYMDIEEGMERYATNDESGSYFPCRYFMTGSEHHGEFKTIEEVAEDVSKIIGNEVKPDVDCIRYELTKYMDSKEDEDFYLYLYEVQCFND